MTELKPCDCGSKRIFIHKGGYAPTPSEYDAFCQTCGKTTKPYPTEAEAIEAWNRRSVK